MSFAGKTHSTGSRQRIADSVRLSRAIPIPRVPFNISIALQLRNAMKKHPEVNWSQVAEEAFAAKLRE